MEEAQEEAVAVEETMEELVEEEETELSIEPVPVLQKSIGSPPRPAVPDSIPRPPSPPSPLDLALEQAIREEKVPLLSSSVVPSAWYWGLTRALRKRCHDLKQC